MFVWISSIHLWFISDFSMFNLDEISCWDVDLDLVSNLHIWLFTSSYGTGLLIW